ncbi:PTS system mannose/fructose/sorbose family transporter subunit IID [Tepidanaerobacter syntrophicus]|uniref:PTS system, mannose-specific IID component n=1 Tax=Tepidanaerobacter syntrophicus TaxID=224999 RepID=A0A0U9HKR1_9FIRM|nr:PTS system mannose/fructose/sorbose family transporter subunit IID [Tepidanaerobacter syntrophicus]GAQ24899.1 PTS system, mannose-specific IID component [Tepidanaerobacter syntrophicus]
MMTSDANSLNELNKVTKKELRSVFWRSFTTSHSWNYERQQHMAFCYSMIPVIRKLYKNKEDRIEAYKRHLEFYNSQATMHPFIAAIVTAMEEENANNPNFDASSISAMKVALMGPLAAIGDSLLAGTLRIIATGIAAGFCTVGNILGPILFLLIYNIPTISLRYIGVTQGYKLGTTFMTRISESDIMEKVTFATSVVGLMVIGAMVASLVNVTTPIAFGIGENKIALQETLDSIFPKLLPLVTTGIIYQFIKKKAKVINVLIGIIVAGIVLSMLGIIG